MLRPTDIENIQGDQSRYAVVVAVAKRARQIADESEEKNITSPKSRSVWRSAISAAGNTGFCQVKG